MSVERSQQKYLYLSLAIVTAISFGLRFWQLDQFDDLIFDEIYYAKFAQSYLTGEALFDAHPPLGKYAIALSIWLHTLFPFTQLGPFANELTLSPVSYRWLNAFTGSLIPLLVFWITKTLTAKNNPSKDLWFVALSSLFVATDGLFITESRYALINIYIVFFGLLGHGLWLFAKKVASRKQAVLYYSLSGLSLGAAISTKWNGLGYLLSLLIWEIYQTVNQKKANTSIQPLFTSFSSKSILFYSTFLGILPIATYCLLWLPHINASDFSFLGLHHTLLTFHQELDSVQTTCSKWYTWPLLIKPMAYAYVEARSQVFTVNNMGNPLLWWLSSASVLLVFSSQITILTKRLARKKSCKNREKQLKKKIIKQERLSEGIKSYLLIGYLANWLPWIVISRCTYIYLFMPAAVFGFILLAWLLSDWLTTTQPRKNQCIAVVMLSAIALAFLFWLPLSIGSPLTPEQLQLRWWLPSWI